MQLKLEVLGQEMIHYNDKVTKEAKTFEVINCREASPATLLLPIRLSARDWPGVKPGTVIDIKVSEVTRGKLDSSISVRGQLVNGK